MAKTKTRIEILTVGINRLTIEEALTKCLEAIGQEKTLRICLPYVEPVMAASRDHDLTRLINQADLVLPNGSGLQWAADYLKYGAPNLLSWTVSLLRLVLRPSNSRQELPERFTSTSFTLPLLERAQKLNAKVLLVGSPKNTEIDNTVKALQNRYPKLELLGFDGAAFNDASLDKLTAICLEAQPDIVLLGLGFSLQEAVAEKLKPLIKKGILIGEGGSFDYQEFGGSIARAPNLLQSLGLEWLWRLLREPKRFRRQLAIPRFMWSVYVYKRKSSTGPNQ